MPDPTPPTPQPTPPAPTPIKPGIKTTEFWMGKIAMALTAVITLWPEGPVWYVRAIAIAGVVLTWYGYNIGRVKLKSSSVAMLVMIFAISSSSACGASQRSKTIRTSYDVTNALSVQWDAFVKAHIDEIQAKATDQARAQEASAELAHFHEQVDKVDKSFAGVWRAIAAASLVNDDVSLNSVIQAGAIVKSELVDLGVIKP